MERMWWSRLRWRLRGGAQWPLFGVLLVGDAVLLHELPIGGRGPDWMEALLLALFFNLVVVAALAPLLGALLRLRRADLPAVVAGDYAGTVLLIATAAMLVVLGLVHRPAIRADRDAFAAQSMAVRRYVAHQAAPVYRRNIDRATSVSFGDDLYRTCVPSARPDRALCLFVHTDQDPPGVQLDPNQAPNRTDVPTPGG